MVLVGIIGEYVHPFVSSLPTLGFWISLKSVWSGAAVAIGIAGEILFSMLAHSREQKASSISAQRRTEAEQKTAEALRAVVDANVLLERERIKRIELEKTVAPRVV